MTEPDPSARTPEPAAVPSWETFYRDYRKPGYIEGFEIQEKLGGGMFGLVFKARRMSIGKDYAVKFLQVDDMEVRRAVLSELEQVKYFAQIDHPNLVSIEDRGEVDGIPYLVMAFAGSETLRDRMPEGRAPTADEKGELVRAFLQCCRGLQALHERSLVHFDIKPANVFLKGSVARLGDYGLSKLVTHSRGSLSMGRGTPYYMAPEMLQRRGDARSDVYSLGVMLYELLCGRVPFSGDSEWEVLRQHESKQPELPAHLGHAEREVLVRCLAKDPAQRFQTVKELLDAFGAPTTAGAAAYAEPAVESTRSVPPPPPPPIAKPAGAEAEVEGSRSDAYENMAKASKDALHHASLAARHAARDAQKVARKAADEARRMWQQGVSRSRNYGIRRWEAMKRLRKQKPDLHDRQDAARVAASIAKPERVSSGRMRRVVATIGALAVVLLLLAGFWLSMGLNNESMRAGSTTYAQATQAPAAPRPLVSGKSTFQSFTVPSRFDALVSTSEPDWARLAKHNKTFAKAQLIEHIQRLRDYAPIEPKQRRRYELPRFDMVLQRARSERADHLIELLLRGSRYERDLANQIIAEGPVGLAAAARAMARLTWEERADLERAKRLQALLVGATGCRDLELVQNGRDLESMAAYNRPLGNLWTWFVNEFAHTDRAWQAYRELLGR